jgi:hypothetical protein
MPHAYYHALSSVKIWGGTVEDYARIHDWLDVIWTRKPSLPLFGERSSMGEAPSSA